MQPQFTYSAQVINVHDGDTITVVVDLGMRVSVTTPIRFNGINAPEIFGTEKPLGEASRNHLIQLLQFGMGAPCEVTVKTYKDPTDKYGRWLADVYLLDGTFVNQKMIDDGFAVAYSG